LSPEECTLIVLSELVILIIENKLIPFFSTFIFLLSKIRKSGSSKLSCITMGTSNQFFLFNEKENLLNNQTYPLGIFISISPGLI
jgi:hypothetical protein